MLLFNCNSQSNPIGNVENADFKIQVFKVGSQATDKPLLPWIKSTDKSYLKNKPIFDLKDTESEFSAKGWLAVSDEFIHLKVEVKDDIHINEMEKATIYGGDGIEIGIDANGDAIGELRGVQGKDDGKLGIALTTKGPDSYVWSLGNPTGLNKPIDNSNYSVIRDEKNKLTTYEVQIPWALFQVKAGQYGVLGIAVQIKDMDPKKEKDTRLYWGKGADGDPAPGLFEKVRIENPLSQLVVLDNKESYIWSPAHSAETIIAIASPMDQTISIKSGDKTLNVTVSGSKSDLSISRYIIKMTPKSLKRNLKYEVTVFESGKPESSKTITNNLVLPELIVNETIQRLDSLSYSSEIHPLFLRHLQSVKALIQGEWAKFTLYRNINPKIRLETYNFISSINEGLKGDAGKWESYTSGKILLTIAFVSKRDNTLQHYLLSIPKDWDPNKSYPMLVELHGAGNPAVLSGTFSQMGPAGGKLDLFGYESNKSYASILRIGYHILPFGRGNSGYVDIGEIDVWEAIDDLTKNYLIDENRRYLFGFSMGGSGTWSIGPLTPDYWAAIGIYAGGGRRGRNPDIGRNLTQLPVWLWCGEKDGGIVGFQNIIKEMAKFGAIPMATSVPGLGHNYVMDAQKAGVEWLLQFTRKRPNSFSFGSDSEQRTGIWGINMVRDLTMSGLPYFDCTIDGNTIKIDSKGTPGLNVKLGSDGLKMTGNVIVMWNGQKSYEGEAKTIQIGTGF
ncbi:MAG: hypothetical protein SFY32_08530 [Bacteroidota bacterium]|nr:hypothetical protein [Bacteroidota bacterium]